MPISFGGRHSTSMLRLVRRISRHPVFAGKSPVFRSPHVGEMELEMRCPGVKWLGDLVDEVFVFCPHWKTSRPSFCGDGDFGR